jgi:hypothetical protein
MEIPVQQVFANRKPVAGIRLLRAFNPYFRRSFASLLWLAHRPYRQ